MTTLDRTIELKLKLEENQIDLRKDSALCNGYISQSINLTLEQVVKRMCEMKYLYEYCNMKKIKYDVYKDFLSERKRTNNKKNKKMKYIKDGSISRKAEKIALDTYSEGKYPEKFPWENKFYNITNFLLNIKISVGFFLMLILVGSYLKFYNYL